MVTIGIRASNKKITFAIYDSEANEISNVECLVVPQALKLPSILKYIRNNVLDIISEYDVNKAGIRVTESSAQGTNRKRIELEAVIQECFASSQLDNYYCGQIATISSLLNMDRADFKPLVDNNQFERVENWGDLNKEEKEAVLTAMGAAHA